ncbi:hypothetical protein JB92DRAFT_1774383 [Gautieria morchelliformis]|nr:hypothetical protein JB92DRAFT_1774383 [Gautieria morchelliformis]
MAMTSGTILLESTTSAYSTVDGHRDDAKLPQTLIHAFHDLVRNGNDNDQYTAIKALGCFPIKGRLLDRVFISDITAVLQCMLRDGRSDNRDVAARLLSELWISDLHGSVFTPETFTVFQSLLQSGNDLEKSFVLEFFFDLTHDNRDDTEFSRSMLNAFQDLLRNGSTRSKYTAIRTFCYHTSA